MNAIQDYKIGVVGAGSWGTTLANLLAEKGFAVTLWVYEEELYNTLIKNCCNTFYLPDIKLHAGIHYTQDIKSTVENKDLVLWVTPVKVFSELFSKAIPFSKSSAIHVSASKGIENGSLKTISQLAEEYHRGSNLHNFTVLSGPSFAQEVAKKMPTAVVIASRDKKTALTVQDVMAVPYFRTYTSEDILGVEIGGALKNVMAVASGIVEGLGYGQNTRAALITRGLAEIIRLGNKVGAQPLTFAGLSGIGDLVLTCTSTLSRNYRVGIEIGKGENLEDILIHMKMVAEGVHTTKAAYALALKYSIDMPIVCEIYRVLFDHKPPRQAVKDLMNRDLKQEL